MVILGGMGTKHIKDTRIRKTEQISIKLDKETRDAFRDICEKEHRPEGQLGRLAIIRFIKAYVQEPA